MKFIKTKIPDVFLIENLLFMDNRGSFLKVFNEKFINENNINFQIKEVYFSISKKNVIRGIHFQLPPYQHAKLVYVPHGSIIDVVLELRKSSPYYGKFISVELSDKNNKSIYIPEGCGHGFVSLEDDSIVTYLQTSLHNSKYDGGIKWNSFGMNWHVDEPIISERDKNFSSFNGFNSPF